jgi:hypothetical protein
MAMAMVVVAMAEEPVAARVEATEAKVGAMGKATPSEGALMEMAVAEASMASAPAPRTP